VQFPSGGFPQVSGERHARDACFAWWVSHKGGLSGGLGLFRDHADREQVLLLPPSLTDRLADAHLAWFTLELFNGLELGAFDGAYEPGWV
jgi:hypothetical protein